MKQPDEIQHAQTVLLLSEIEQLKTLTEQKDTKGALATAVQFTIKNWYIVKNMKRTKKTKEDSEQLELKVKEPEDG